MSPTVKSLIAAAAGAALWLLWSVEQEHTAIRAPWTGVTLVASALCFVIAGVVGRGWRAVLSAAAVGAVAVLLVGPLVWEDPAVEPLGDESCDPGCLSLGAAVAIEAMVVAALAAVGIALRRAVGAVRGGRRLVAHARGDR